MNLGLVLAVLGTSITLSGINIDSGTLRSLNNFKLHTKRLDVTEYIEHLKAEIEKSDKEIEKPDKVPMIIDLDFASDVDDACAVRVATSLHKLGRIDIKGIALCIEDLSIAGAMAGLLEYDGIQNPIIGTSALNIPSTSPYWGDRKSVV